MPHQLQIPAHFFMRVLLRLGARMVPVCTVQLFKHPSGRSNCLKALPLSAVLTESALMVNLQMIAP